MTSKYSLLKFSCYTANTTMSIVANLSPILFLTFHSLYNISYSLLGLLVLVNFTTQLIIDLIFSFFSQKFNISKAVKITPLLGSIGLLIYAVWPILFPDAVYVGILIGTVIFSASSGFAEVLISPVIAAIPAEDPDREMSKLHSVYAWGVVATVIISTLYLLIFGAENWQYLAIFFIFVPLTSFISFLNCDIPEMKTPEKASGIIKQLKNKNLWLCFAAIFLGGAAELTMAQWSSGYLEQALSIPKVWGDVFGVALFALMMGIGRTMYAKQGKNITNVLLFGTIGATACYLVTAITNIPFIGLAACALTGLCVSMLWPGSLIVAADKMPQGGVFIYAMMAAGGDLGASVGPQIIGIVTDAAIANDKLSAFAQNINLLPEQLGMKMGLLLGALFPLLAIPIILYFKKSKTN